MKRIKLSAVSAIISSIVLSGTSAHAMSLADDIANNRLTGFLAINLNGLVQSIDSDFLDLGDDNGEGPSASIGITPLTQSNFSGTGSFAGITGGSIKDLRIGGSFNRNDAVDFLTFTDGSATVTFDIIDLIDPRGGRRSFESGILGAFRPTDQLNDIDLDFLQFQLTRGFNTGNIELTPIPTPAVIPGIISMGFAALRKKAKSEESEITEAET